MQLNDVNHLQHTLGNRLSTLLTDGPGFDVGLYSIEELTNYSEGEIYYFLLIRRNFFTMLTWYAPLKHLKKWRRRTTSIDNITPLPPSP